jgi:hypothetical protein
MKLRGKRQRMDKERWVRKGGGRIEKQKLNEGRQGCILEQSFIS